MLKTREFPAKFPTCRELPHGDWFAATVVSATHSASPETFAVCGKLPVFPGLCPPKSGPQIGDRRKAGFCALIRPAVSNAVTSEEFVEGFTPPDYLIDGFLQRQFIYALTGQTRCSSPIVSPREELSGRAKCKLGASSFLPAKT